MSDEVERSDQEQLVYGVPARKVVDALRGAGVAEEDVIAAVGRGIARSSGMNAVAATSPFVFQTQVAQQAPDCELHFDPTFRHPDFIDGVTVVQAGETPTEIGFNQRFHAIETDLDDVAEALRTVSNCMKELRLELFGVVQELQEKITEIDTRLDAKVKDKDKDSKEKEKEKDKESKEKDKEGKDDKESKEKDRKEKDKEKDKKDKEEVDVIGSFPPDFPPLVSNETEGGDERTFISLEDRPEVGRAVLADPNEGS